MLDDLRLHFHNVRIESGTGVTNLAAVHGVIFSFLTLSENQKGLMTAHPLQCIGQQLCPGLVSAGCARRRAWSPAGQHQPGGRERWTMIGRHDSWVSRNCPPDRRHGCC